MYVCFFLYISGRVTVPNEFLPFTPFVFLLMYSNNRTSFDTSAYYTNGVILFKYDYDYDDDDDGDDDDDVDDDDYYYIITNYLMIKQIYSDQ